MMKRMAILFLLAAPLWAQTHTFPALDTNNKFTGDNNFSSTLECKNFEGVRCVDSANSAGWTGADVGAWINAAYADLPSSGGTIYVFPKSDGTCYSFTTPIVLSTSNKFPRIEFLGTSQNNGASGGACLNYTPTSGSAITLDYVSATGSPLSSNHGLVNLTLINNGCVTKGGCGGTAVGIDTGTTNAGSYEASMSNVSVIGFSVGYRNLNNSSVQISWFHPKFSYNATAIRLSSITNLNFFGGQMAGNGTVFKTDATTSTPDVACFGTSFFNNTGLIFDATTTTSIAARFDGYGCHLENSGTDSANYISGLVDVHLHGGVVENDNAATQNWFFSVSGQEFYTSDVEYICQGTCTNILVANSPVRGILGGNDRSNTHFTTYVGGANAAFIGQEMLPGPSSVTAVPFLYEYLKSPTVEVGTGQGFIIDEGAAPNGSGTASKTQCYSDSTAHAEKCSDNGNAYSVVPRISGAVTAGHFAAFMDATHVQDGGPSVANVAFTSKNLAGQVSGSAGAVTTIDSVTLSALPASCGTNGCRIHVIYSYYIYGGTLGFLWVDDGTNTGGMGYFDTNTNFSMAAASYITPGTYSSGATPTISIKGDNGGTYTVCPTVSAAGGTCGSAPTGSPAVPSRMQIEVVQSN